MPGEIDMYGVQLSGLPGLAIGFSEDFGWTHTVSAGDRFTAYRLDLVPGDPTSYLYGEEQRSMTPEEMTIEVLGDDGQVSEQVRTMWRTHYGPVLDFPGIGWSDSTTITMRDANIDNDEFVEQYLALVKSTSLDDLIELNETYNGVPLFNTVAVSSDGRAWTRTPRPPLPSDEAIAAYEASLESDLLVKLAGDNGAVLLDGSNPLFEWATCPAPVTRAWSRTPSNPGWERDDYVFNANDSVLDAARDRDALG